MKVCEEYHYGRHSSGNDEIFLNNCDDFGGLFISYHTTMFLTTTGIKQKLAFDFGYMGFRVTSKDGEMFECRSERPRKYIKSDSKEKAMKLIKEWRINCSW